MMRSHLFACLEARQMTPFPHKRLQADQGNLVKSHDDFEVYCHCRMPQLKTVLMIECNKCKKWFHVPCENVPHHAVMDPKTEWYCRCCSLVP